MKFISLIALLICGSVFIGADVAMLGIDMIPIPYRVAVKKNIDPSNGIYVTSVKDMSLAADMGINAGDIVLALNSREIHCMNDIRIGMVGKGVNDAVVASVLRDGKVVDLTGIVKVLYDKSALTPLKESSESMYREYSMKMYLKYRNRRPIGLDENSINGSAQQVDSAEPSTNAVPPSIPSGSAR